MGGAFVGVHGHAMAMHPYVGSSFFSTLPIAKRAPAAMASRGVGLLGY